MAKEKKINPVYYSTEEGLRWSANSTLCNVTLVWIASALLTFILRDMLRLDASGGTLSRILLFVSPVASLIASFMIIGALRREKQAGAVRAEATGEKKRSGFFTAMTVVTVACVVLTFIVYVLYLYFVGIYLDPGSPSLNAEQSAGVARLRVQMSAFLNILAVLVSVSNVAGILALKEYISGEKKTPVSNAALCAAAAALCGIVISVAYYLTLYNGGTPGAVFNIIEKLFGFAVYFLEYLFFRARKEKYRRLTEEKELAVKRRRENKTSSQNK